jgi:hypothetical protein
MDHAGVAKYQFRSDAYSASNLAEGEMVWFLLQNRTHQVDWHQPYAALAQEYQTELQETTSICNVNALVTLSR